MFRNCSLLSQILKTQNILPFNKRKSIEEAYKSICEASRISIKCQLTRSTSLTTVTSDLRLKRIGKRDVSELAGWRRLPIIHYFPANEPVDSEGNSSGTSRGPRRGCRRQSRRWTGLIRPKQRYDRQRQALHVSLKRPLPILPTCGSPPPTVTANYDKRRCESAHFRDKAAPVARVPKASQHVALMGVALIYCWLISKVHSCRPGM